MSPRAQPHSAPFRYVPGDSVRGLGQHVHHRRCGCHKHRRSWRRRRRIVQGDWCGPSPPPGIVCAASVRSRGNGTNARVHSFTRTLEEQRARRQQETGWPAPGLEDDQPLKVLDQAAVHHWDHASQRPAIISPPSHAAALNGASQRQMRAYRARSSSPRRRPRPRSPRLPAPAGTGQRLAGGCWAAPSRP